MLFEACNFPLLWWCMISQDLFFGLPVCVAGLSPCLQSYSYIYFIDVKVSVPCSLNVW